MSEHTEYALKLSSDDSNAVFGGTKRLLMYEKALETPVDHPYYVMVDEHIVGTIELGHGFRFDDEDEFALAKSLHGQDTWVDGSVFYRVVRTAPFLNPVPVRVGQKDADAQVLEVEKMSGVVTTNVWKSAGEERIIAAAVLVPGKTDLHDEIYDEDTVRAAAYYFMENYLQDDDHGIDVMHDNEVVPDAIRVLQSFVLDEDKTYEVEVPALDSEHEMKEKTEISFPIGTWIMYARVISDTLWEKVKRGELKSWSIAGLARVKNLQKLLRAA